MFIKTKYREIALNEAQAKLDKICDAAVTTRQVVIIKRSVGPDVALLAAGELSALIETLYLLRSPRNVVRLITALNRAHRVG